MPSPTSSSPHPPRISSLLPSSPTFLPATDQNAPRQRKKRDLLKNYYGVSAGSGQDDADNVKEQKPDPLNLDNYAFNAELCVNNALVKEHLPELIQRDNELVSAIKQLDGDMKTLVYENYNKFIAATDTIKKMRTDIDDMQKEMAKLSDHLKNISEASTNINNGLAEKRDSIRKLSGVHNLLQKLNFVFELPTRLRQCLNKKLYSQAVRYYARTSNLLVHYRHIPAFKKIEDECLTIMDQVKHDVRQKLASDKSTMKEIAESVGLLIGMNAMSPLELAQEYMKCGAAQLRRVKASAVQHVKTMVIMDTPAPDSSESEAEALSPEIRLLVDQVDYLDRIFLEELTIFVDGYYVYFLSEETPISPKSFDSHTSGQPTFSAVIPSNERQKVKDDLNSTVDAILKEYFGVVNDILKIPEDITQLAPLRYLHVLDKLHQDVYKMELLKQRTKVHKKVNALAFDLLSRIISAIFAKVKKEFVGRYDSYNPDTQADLLEFVRTLNNWIKDTLVNQCLPILENFARPNRTFMQNTELGTDDILDQIQRNLDVFWISFSDEMLSYSHSKHGDKAAFSCLLMSRSALELCNGTVEGVMAAYNDVLFSKKTDMSHAGPKLGPPKRRNPQVVTTGGGTAGGLGGSYGSRPNLRDGPVEVEDVQIRAREIAGHCRLTAQKLLTCLVEMLANQLSLVVQEHMQTTEWTAIPAVTSVSPTWIRIVEELGMREVQVGQLYPDDASERKDRASLDSNRRSSRAPTHSRSGSQQLYKNPHSASSTNSFSSGYKMNLGGGGGGRYDAMLSNIDKLFAERIEYYGKVELTKGSVLNGIAKIVLKCFQEETRLVTFNTEGFHQIQVDSEYLRTHFWPYMSDDRLLGNLLDEVLTSASRRCVDPQALEYAAIDSILSSVDVKIGQQ
ncbi:Vacuolar protein sorting-associated protein 51 [Rhizophlyctis rosea]|uniref:Vacuolar protein sorting-associated protein 51 homolog n=1 Tax=Rhizophlyctis rosea TaxID=64517 RepID=A0AAD5SJF0_9FUNG|nr:Vacuolar protein sorting-associated protein 51 [Rhizophlyctis rosea]